MPLDVEFIARERPQNNVVYLPTTGSTMTEAARLASQGAPHGTLMIAEEQTAGIGRFGRHWYSEAGLGIYSSTILRLPIASNAVPLVTLALGLATAEAIEHTTGLACDLRWPNDVLVNERKVAGILAQLQDGCVIAGIGINVNQPELPADLRTPATSLRMVAGRAFSREKLIVALLEALDDFGSMLVDRGAAAILAAFSAASSYVLHRRIIFEGNDGPRRGITAGLDANGFLLVNDHTGISHTVYTGGVRPDVS